MMIDFQRITQLSGVKYSPEVKKKKILKKKKVKKKFDLMETEAYKSDIKEAAIQLLQMAEKDGQTTFKTRTKERVVINGKEYSSKNIKGIITILIDSAEIKESGFTAQEIAYELKINKDFYKKEIDVVDVIDGKNEEVDECYINIKDNNIILKLYYSSEK